MKYVYAIFNLRKYLKYSSLPAVEVRIKSLFTGICHIDQFKVFARNLPKKWAKYVKYVAIFNLRKYLKYSSLPAVEVRLKGSFTGICHIDQFKVYSNEV